MRGVLEEKWTRGCWEIYNTTVKAVDSKTTISNSVDDLEDGHTDNILESARKHLRMNTSFIKMKVADGTETTSLKLTREKVCDDADDGEGVRNIK